jgi:membrane protein DedA with SNARE-associated domain
MNAVVQIILPYILLYQYYAIFSITFLAALVFPIPPGTLLMASAAFAAQGYLSFFWVVFFGSLGNIAGDNLAYWLARRYGKNVLLKIGFRKILESERYAAIEKKLLAKPGAIIVASRFEVFTNLAVNIICGLSKVPYKKYIVHEAAGEFAQVLIYCSIGYFIGDNWQYVSGLISRFLMLILIVGILVAVLFWHRSRRKKAHITNA